MARFVGCRSEILWIWEKDVGVLAKNATAWKSVLSSGLKRIVIARVVNLKPLRNLTISLEEGLRSTCLFLFTFISISEGQTRSKRFFQADVSSKKQTNAFYFTTMKPQVDLFYGGNWGHQKDISKSTDLKVDQKSGMKTY